MHLAALLAATLLSIAPEALVLRDGGTIPVRRVVSVDEQRIVFQRADGVLFSLPLNEIDLEKTAGRAAVSGEERAAGSRPRRDKSGTLPVSDEEKERLLRTLEKTARPGSSPPPLPREPTAEPQAAEDRDAKAAEEQRWRARANAARDRVALAELALSEAVRYERELNAFLLAMAGPSGIPEVYSTYMRDLADTRSRIPRLQEEAGRAREALRDLTTEAIRAGAMPGWVR